jgi:CBS domain-containing protein
MFVEQMLPRARERLTTIDAAASIGEAAALMSGPHIDLVVVCGQDGGMVGVLTKTDIVGQMAQCAGGVCTARARVDTIMTRAVISCRSGDALQDIWSTMKARGLQRNPLVDRGGKPMGIVYARDALQNLLGEAKNEEALLRDYVMGVGYR